ncbi:hypothetical protein ABEY41_19355 [Peribacillus butanolivorans]
MAVGISQSNPLANIRSMVNNNFKGVKPVGSSKEYNDFNISNK